VIWCIPNAPKQHGDLWVELTDDNIVKVMNPAGSYWRGKTFTLEQFKQELKDNHGRSN
jgi:hypothetical protein